MAKATSATRAPHGTKILAKAFFTAADEVPEPQRADVIKAALALIREELKTRREKAAVAKAKAKEKGGKAPATTGRKAAVVTKAPSKAKAPAKAVQKAGSVSAKAPPKRDRKAPSLPDAPARDGRAVGRLSRLTADLFAAAIVGGH